MRFKLFAAVLLLLAPAPALALADVTAHYSIKDKTLVIEAEDGGNARVTIADNFSVIRRDGVDYAVVKDPAGGFKIARLDDLLMLVRAQMKDAVAPGTADEKADLSLIQGGSETVAGHPGTVWSLGPAAASQGGDSAKARPPGDGVDFVVSPDPQLKPIGVFLRHLVDTASTVLPGFGNTNVIRRVDELFDRGTPVRIGPILKLTAIDTGEIADDRFVLPGPVLTAAEFLEAVNPSKAAQALPPAP